MLAAAVMLSRNHADPDFWGHVQYGRDVLEKGLPLTATYTYTAVHFPWINHENLAELFFAWTVDRIGVPFLLGLKAASGAALAALLWWRLRKAGLSLSAATVVLLGGLANVMFFWTLRPQWFSLIFFAVLLALLDDDYERLGRHHGNHPPPPRPTPLLRKLLWGAPWLFAVWANTHGGFVLGLAVLAAYLGLSSLERLWRERLAALPWIGRAATVVVLCAAATLVNPYGWRLHTWLVYSLGNPRPEIAEWHPPRLFDPVFVPWWSFLAFAVLVGVATLHRRSWVRTVLLVLFAWQALEHLRHIPFFALAFLWWCGPDVAYLLAGLRRWARRNRPSCDSAIRPPWWLWAASGAVACLLAGLLVTQMRAIPVSRQVWPVDALQFMADQRLSGRVVARFNWAQYVLETFANAPVQQPVTLAVDGRFRTCYPRRVLDAYFDFAQGTDRSCRNRAPDSPPFDPTRILRLGNPDLVLIGCDERLPCGVMRSYSDEWVLLYRDGTAELWGRRSRYDDPKSPHYLPPQQRKLHGPERRGHVAWPAHPVWPAASAGAVDGA
ncbi:MAG: hypothetical protein KatS3mg110_3971 [Pirellulaceae bacterium]|nr:MAG: hypothetical protein KatS3mg110_3971 [Pirellulaceae bacterium]